MSKYVFFDWSTLDRNYIISHIMSLSPMLLGNKISAVGVHSIIKNKLKSLAPFKIKKTYTYKVDPGIPYVGGSYYSYLDQEYDNCIEICFYYFDKDTQIQFNRKQLHDTATLIADTVLHEIMHMRQYRRREFKSLPDYNSKAYRSDIRKEQAYLGNTDELDAYAFNIACELHEKFKGNTCKIVNYLNKPLKRTRHKNTWKIYLKAFEYDHNHLIIKRLKKKVVGYLPAAAIGKPYKSNDWINW